MRRRWPLLFLIPLAATAASGLKAATGESSPEEVVRGLALDVPLAGEWHAGGGSTWVRTGPNSFARVRDGVDRALKGRARWNRVDDGMTVVWSYDPWGPPPWWRRVPGVDRLIPNLHPTASIRLSRGRAVSPSEGSGRTKRPWTTVMVYAYDDRSAHTSLAATDGWSIWDVR